MKKILKIALLVILIAIVVSLLIFNTKDYVDVVKQAIEHAELVELYDVKAKDVIRVYEDESLKRLIEDLDYSKWKEIKSLNNNETTYILRLYEDRSSGESTEIEIFASLEHVSVVIDEDVKLYETNHSLKDILK